MTGPRIGLTDLERAKYTGDSSIDESTVRVRPDQPIEVSTVGNVENIENVESVDLIDEVSNVSSVDLVDEVTNVSNVESVDLVDEITHVSNVDLLDIVSEVNHVTNVDLVDIVDNVNSVDEVTHVTNIDSLDVVTEVAHITNLDSVDLITEVAHVTNLDLVDELTHVTTVQTVQAVTSITNPIKQQDYSVVPHETYNHFLRYLLNGSSADQNVNGSVTPVDFATVATSRSLVHSFDVVIVARNLVSIMDYGTISGGLTNGIQIIRKISGVETVFATIRKMVEYAHPSLSGAFETVSLKSNATEDVIVVSIILKDPIIIQTGDSMIMRIRDNLTEATSGIPYQRASVLLKEV